MAFLAKSMGLGRSGLGPWQWLLSAGLSLACVSETGTDDAACREPCAEAGLGTASEVTSMSSVEPGTELDDRAERDATASSSDAESDSVGVAVSDAEPGDAGVHRPSGLTDGSRGPDAAPTTAVSERSDASADAAISANVGVRGDGGETNSSDAAQAFECVPVDPASGCHNENSCGLDGFCDPNATSESFCGGAQFPDECIEDVDCGAGFICELQRVDCRTYNGCVVACTEASCRGTTRCAGDGRCVALLCDEDGGPVCATDQRCNPGAPRADVNGCEGLPCDGSDFTCSESQRCAPEIVGADAHGCVALNCAEPGGPECLEGWRCDTTATTPYCVPIHCAEVGGRSCPATTRCDPDAQANGGCMAVPCSVAADCDCGVCIENVCYNRAGKCQYFAP